MNKLITSSIAISVLTIASLNIGYASDLKEDNSPTAAVGSSRVQEQAKIDDTHPVCKAASVSHLCKSISGQTALIDLMRTTIINKMAQGHAELNAMIQELNSVGINHKPIIREWHNQFFAQHFAEEVMRSYFKRTLVGASSYQLTEHEIDNFVATLSKSDPHQWHDKAASLSKGITPTRDSVASYLETFKGAYEKARSDNLLLLLGHELSAKKSK